MKRRAQTALAAMVTTLPLSAGAVEREYQIGPDLGSSILVVGGRGTDIGPSIGAQGSYGLSDAFNLVAEGAWSLEAFTAHPTWAANANVGITYVFDVMQWVPYAGLLIGGYGIGGRDVGSPKFLPGAAVALGVDYRFSHDVAIGVALREHMLTEPSTYPSFIQAFARIEYTWGW
jgi:hypothetical protein